MKVLVTGGNGYIGSHTIIQLIKAGYDVVSVDNLCRSKAGTMDRIKQITGVNVENYMFDLCNANECDIVISNTKPDVIIHFAAYKCVPESVKHPEMYYNNNVVSMINVLNSCEKHSIQNLIFSSSCSVYGNMDSMPVTENTPIGKAMCPYAHTKQICESILENICSIRKNFSAISLRYFNPVGADMSGLNGELSKDESNNLVPVIMETGIGKRQSMTVFGNDYDTRDGSCIRDYVHVTDIADAHVKAINYLQNNKNENYSIFNLGSENGVSVFEMIEAFEEVTGHKLNYIIGERRPGDVQAIYSDCSKAKRLLGWECKYNIYDMIESAWLWEKTKQNLN